MHEDLHRYLDGDLPAEAMPPELRGEADAWDKIMADFAVLREDRAPAWIEAQVMNQLPPAPLPPLWNRVVRWLLEPQSIRVRPIVGLVGAVAVMLLVALPVLDRAGHVEPGHAGPTAT